MPLKQLGRYEVIEELGHGAMGVIYKAFDPLLDRLVALKTVALELSQEETEAFERRFYREARSAGRLNHPNIVTIHDVGKTDSVAYIAMEFLQGRSLRNILDSGVVLPIERVVDIGARVADGLAFAHESGIVHRDVKPPNIMVLENGGVKITDFGIAVFSTGSRTLAGTVFGSPKYMSPEQVVGREVDGRSDVFSLGAVLYEMLTGFAAFSGGDLEAVLYQVINEMPALPTTRNKALPPAFDYIVAKALAKHPDDRYGSARAFAADLRNFRNLHAPAAAPQPARTLERRALRRRKGEIPGRPHAAASPGMAGSVVAPGSPSVPSPAAAVRTTASPGSRPPVATSPTTDALRHPGRMLLIGVPVAFLIFGGAMLAVRGFADRAPPAEGVRVITPALTPAVATPAVEAIAGDTARVAAPAQGVEVAPPKLGVAGPASTSNSRAGDTPLSKASARLGLAVSPWGEIYVDGKKRGISPPITEIKLVPGKHVIEIRNASFAPYADTVNLEANAYLKIKHRFR
jgi:predicted Ser/Thr protein kinase